MSDIALGSPMQARAAADLLEVVESIAKSFTLPQLLSEVVRQTQALCGADGASLLLMDPNTGELIFQDVAGSAAGILERARLKPGQGVAGQVAQTGEAILVAQVSASSTFDPGIDQWMGFRTASILAVPLLVDGRCLGVLEAVRSEAAPEFGASEFDTLTRLAPHVAIAVHNSQLTAKLRAAQLVLTRTNEILERRVEERTEQIVRAKREWETTFDAIAEPIALIQNFVIRRANLAYATRSGRKIAEVVGLSCHQLLANRTEPCVNCPLRSPETRRIGGVATPEGSVFDVSAFELGAEGGGGFVVHYRDRTHERRLEEKLRHSERMAALGQLASGAAHEINNPLGFLMSNLQTLQAWVAQLEGAPEPVVQAESLAEARDMLEESLSGGRRVQAIVGALRQLSRLQTSGEELADVNSSVTRAVRSELTNMGHQAILQLGATRLVRIMPLQLDQAIVQLLRNARQATADASHIAVSTADVGAEVLVSVRDRGCGIAGHHLSRLFEPFFTTRGIGKGMGLGLTAAFGVVQGAGGTIEVESEVGRGSTFVIRLPAVAPSSESADDAASTGVVPHRPG